MDHFFYILKITTVPARIQHFECDKIYEFVIGCIGKVGKRIFKCRDNMPIKNREV